MNKDLIDVGFQEFIKNQTPKLNPDLAQGLAYVHGSGIEAFIDNTFRAVIKGIDNFEYVGCKRVSPIEEFTELTKPRESKRVYDLARSDTYMMKYIFRFNGVEYYRLILLPFISPGGLMHIKGAQYAISPVLADTVIEVTPPNLFVRLLRDRLTFTRAPHIYISNNGLRKVVNGKARYNDKRETIPVVRSAIYNQTDEMKSRKKKYNLDTNLVFYLLCKYGATEMFKRFTDSDVLLFNYDDPLLAELDEDEWIICRSTGTQPQTLAKGYYKPTPIVLAIKRKQYTKTNKALIAGMFYVLDHFNEEISLEDLDTTVRWSVCMGMRLWGHEPNAGKLLTDFKAHLNSLDNYIETITYKKFLSIGLDIKDIYHLFFVIIDKYDEWQASFVNNESNLYGKELSILYYLLSDLTTQIVKFYFKMMKDSKKGLTTNDVINNMNRLLKTGTILGIYKGHGEISVVNNSCDNMVPRVTQILVPQDKTGKNKKVSRTNINATSLRLHVSVAEICTYCGMTKASPDGRTRLNLYVDVDPVTGKILRSEDLRDMLDKVQAEINIGRLTVIEEDD
jgi:hypothetical protein